MVLFSRRIVLFVISFFALAIFLAAGYRLVLPEYRLYVDGQVMSVRGWFGRVEEVVVASGVASKEGDFIDPPLVESADPSKPIQIWRAKTLYLQHSDGGETLYHTHQTTIGGFLRESGLQIERADSVVADGEVLSWRQTENAPLPKRLQIGRYHTVTILDGAQTISLTTKAQTVAEAIAEAKITLYSTDGVQPPLETWLAPQQTITIQRSQPLTIVVDGRTLTTRSHHTRIIDVLAEVGIGLVGADYTRPSLDLPLQPNDRIEVIRVQEQFFFEDISIPFDSVWQATELLEIDQTGLLVAGVNGTLRRQTGVRYENGVEIGRFPAGEWIEKPAIAQVMGYGTNIVVRTEETPEGPIEYWRKVRMRVTSYTAATSGKDPSDPWYGITASGRPAGYGVVAVDRNIIPWRSHVYVPGYGVGFAGDVGGEVLGRWIDLGYDEANFQWWRGYVDVYYLTPVPEPHKINYRLPTWLP